MSISTWERQNKGKVRGVSIGDNFFTNIGTYKNMKVKYVYLSYSLYQDVSTRSSSRSSFLAYLRFSVNFSFLLFSITRNSLFYMRHILQTFSYHVVFLSVQLVCYFKMSFSWILYIIPSLVTSIVKFSHYLFDHLLIDGCFLIF